MLIIIKVAVSKVMSLHDTYNSFVFRIHTAINFLEVILGHRNCRIQPGLKFLLLSWYCYLFSPSLFPSFIIGLQTGVLVSITCSALALRIIVLTRTDPVHRNSM